MWRRLKEKNDAGKLVDKVYGVLTDYDLSSWTAKMNADYVKTSQHRTGTPPYMAQELLRGTSSVHLYRHDVESLFYIMLLTAARRTIEIPKGRQNPRIVMRESKELPFQNWFNEPRYHNLGLFKQTFFTNEDAIELSEEFEDFRPWLHDLQHLFHLGFKAQPLNVEQPRLLSWEVASTVENPDPPSPEFDDETLGGKIRYFTLLASVPHLKGKLKGLHIRDPGNPVQSPSA